MFSDTKIENLCLHNYKDAYYRVDVGEQYPLKVMGADMEAYLEGVLPGKLKENIDIILQTLADLGALENEADKSVAFEQPYPFSEITVVEDHRMIAPYYAKKVRENRKGEKVLSYGLSSMGYDLRVADEFKICTNALATHNDPKKPDPRTYVDYQGPVCIIPPHSFVLARTMEYIRMPRDVLGICLSKSTYARVGITCIATPLEPAWEGYVTLEFTNNTPLPSLLYAGEGALQVLFQAADGKVRTDYVQAGGKYQRQGREIVLPRV